METHLVRASAWLRAAERPEGGWGYSERVDRDADSTALAWLFLGGDRNGTAERLLCDHQQSDGGFATFTREASYGSWTESHPEVSATALLALLPTRFCRTDGMTRGIRYLRTHQRADGLWDSFWWATCLYATEAALTFLLAAGERIDGARLATALRGAPTNTSFESALLLLCLTRIGHADDIRAGDCADALRAEQLPDGSFPSGPILRLPDRGISEPWAAEDAGPLFGDAKRVFTTATALAALALYEAA
jgi:hypothetical protein